MCSCCQQLLSYFQCWCWTDLQQLLLFAAANVVQVPLTWQVLYILHCMHAHTQHEINNNREVDNDH
jgi:hypothetical protein